MTIFPRRIVAQPETLADGGAIAFCPVGVVRDACGAHWRLLAHGTGWKLVTMDGAHAALVSPGDAGFQSYDPNWPAVRNRVQKALKETAKGVDATPTPSGTASATPTPTKSSTAKAKSDDLEAICGYHPEKEK